MAYLQDNYLGNYQLLSLTDTNNIIININNSVPASYNKNRFRILFLHTPVALPIAFINVNAVKKNTSIEVSWQTADQAEVLRYDVHRSTNGVAFNKAAEVTAFTGSSVGTYKSDGYQPRSYR